MRVAPPPIASLGLCLAVCLNASALAQSSSRPEETLAAETPEPPETAVEAGEHDRNPFTKGVRVYLGRTAAEDDAGLEDPDGDTTVGVDFGDRLPGLGGYLGYDVGVWFSFRDYDNALDAATGITDPQIEANWFAVTGGLRLTVPRETAFQFYGVAGAGIFRSVLSSSGPGYVGKAEDHDTGLGGYAGLGVEYNWPTWALGLDVRRLLIPADFDDFGLEDVDLGGTYAGLVVRKKF